jgi:hypothetical protein
MTKPILLVHGEEDTNSGTNVIQSERFFAALKGNGAEARLVLLPHEVRRCRLTVSTPVLTALMGQRFSLQYDESLSHAAFDFNLRRYNESHSTRGFESVCHTLAETSEFLDRHTSIEAAQAAEAAELARAEAKAEAAAATLAEAEAKMAKL